MSRQKAVTALILTVCLTLILAATAREGQIVSVQPAIGFPEQSRPTMPPRDPRMPAEKTGTASISGRVTAAENDLPLRRVQVRVAGPELRGMHSTTTDADGRYVVGNLPAGRYTIVFTKSGFVQAQFGQKRPNQPGKPVQVRDAEKADSVDIALTRGGVITGRVLDEYGEPVVDARVQAMQYRWFNGKRRLANTGGRMNVSNDRGEFRVWGLPPGEYYVSAIPNDRQMFMDAASARNDTSDSSGYAPTYYPGTAIVDEAQRVSVALGQEVSGIDFSLVTTRTVRVSGTVLNSDGKPAVRSNVMLLPRSSADGGMMMPQGGGTDATGSFTISGVVPGEYVIQARSGFGPVRPGDLQMASQPLNVGGEDIRNLTLVMTGGVRVSGRVIFEDSPPPGSHESLRVFMPQLENEFVLMGGMEDERVTPQGTFSIRGVLGKRRIFLGGLPTGWTLKAVRIGVNDVTDTGFEFGKEHVDNVEVVVTNRTTSLSGTVKGANDGPAADYVVLAFSTDEAFWDQGSRRLGMARPDQNGTFNLRSLPPGSYYVVAVESMPEEWGNPELFEQLKVDAKRATLNEGEHQTLDLRLQASPLPR